MIINPATKIAVLIKHNSESLEAIVSINPKFEKLRNPILRKLMAGRTTIAMASRISGTPIETFYGKLMPLGFEIDQHPIPDSLATIKQPPLFIQTLDPGLIITLDVRPYIDKDEDPLPLIMKNIKALKKGEFLKIINSFEPFPLIQLLNKQGFKSYAHVIHAQIVDTYFYKDENIVEQPINVNLNTSGWDEYQKRFDGKMVFVDVRMLPMPQPMITIMKSIESLPEGMALYVYHKRIPVFLLPELKDNHWDYRIKEISNDEVHLLIFKP